MRDVFVNKTILYKNTADLLTEILNDVNWTVRWADDILKTKWVDPEVITKANSIKRDSESAIKVLQKVFAILREFKNMPNKAKVNAEFKRLECVTVIKGGLYVEPIRKVVDVLSEEGARFFKEDKNKENRSV